MTSTLQPADAGRRRSPRPRRVLGSGRPAPLPATGGELAPEGPVWEELAPRGLYARFGRRAFDLTLLALGAGPALALGLACAVGNWIAFRRLDRVLFFQERVGRRGRRFRIVKFRTMAEAPAGEFASWGSGGDRLRVTRFGRFLRNTHLDELPQLLNVLRGDMAIVGPRPEMVEIEAWAAGEIPGFTTRLAVPPGITGWAQVTQGYTGNDVEAYREKFRVADWYRRNQSLRVDLEVVLRTVVWMVRGRGWRWDQGDPRRRVELPEA